MNRIEITFASAEAHCAAWHYPGSPGRFDTPAGRPCVVMAHGFGATRDGGLDGFAEAFATAGLDVVAFDYRGFGTSGGEPRQVADPAAQLADYRAAVAAARRLNGVDPERIVLWGVSFAGGHVLEVAAADPRVAATVALTPVADGLAAASSIFRREGVSGALRTTVAGLRDVVGSWLGRPPYLVRLTGAPGTLAALTAPGALEDYTSMAGPTWRNEVAGRAFLRLPTYRPGRAARRIVRPLLVQLADLDQSAPAGAAQTAASRAPRAEVRHYPCDHFDIYPGRGWHEAAVAHQLAFLHRHLAAAEAATPS
ncbi:MULTISPECIES: alpha/beta hydrolase [unclassified Pseudonocardia]|uniref:alpha/beta hydrolase n=1 Tax=unclassified Pseudonocardia TaxID=2619320 RepID=UPI000A62BF06|nr:MULTISPECIES: alpha/beta hydrolase [unclassified Pseudonocardia]